MSTGRVDEILEYMACTAQSKTPRKKPRIPTLKTSTGDSSSPSASQNYPPNPSFYRTPWNPPLGRESKESWRRIPRWTPEHVPHPLHSDLTPHPLPPSIVAPTPLPSIPSSTAGPRSQHSGTIIDGPLNLDPADVTHQEMHTHSGPWTQHAQDSGPKI